MPTEELSGPRNVSQLENFVQFMALDCIPVLQFCTGQRHLIPATFIQMTVVRQCKAYFRLSSAQNVSVFRIIVKKRDPGVQLYSNGTEETA